MATRRIVYLEPFSGISGDMLIGALLDLGIGFDSLREGLSRLRLTGYRVSVQKCVRAGVHASKFDVHDDAGPGAAHSGPSLPDSHGCRRFTDIRQMIEASTLSEWVKAKSIEAFRKLAVAEGKIHNQSPEEVHFHEVGAIDSIVDIVGSMIVAEQLLPARFVSSAVNVGQGTLECRHGTYPVPGPATQELLMGIPTFANEVRAELTTPTGATLLTTLVNSYGARPLMRIQSTGYGAGTLDTPGNANVLRVTLGEELMPELAASAEEHVVVIEATIDDMNPQIYGYFQERALASGALDVYATPVQMKKNRPALALTVVCAPAQLESLARLIFAETTTIGIRYTIAQRKTLERRFRQVDTDYGPVRIKVSFLNGERMNFVPEYEDCRKLATEKGVALKEVIAAATRAYLQAERQST